MTTNDCIRLHECVEARRQTSAIELSVAAAVLEMKKSYVSTKAKKIASLKLAANSQEASFRWIS
jgi:hypothetical protein